MSNKMSAGGKIVNDLYNNDDFRSLFISVYQRWIDERAFEDIKEYATFLKDMLPNFTTELTFVKLTQRPFGVVLSHDKMQYWITLNARGGYEWKRIK